MDKTAQRRGILNKIREKANIPKSYLERYFQPELKKAMEAIIAVDNKVRAELTGSVIEKVHPEDKISAKELIKSARSHFNRREYMPGIADLAHFRKKMVLVSQAINSLKDDTLGIDFEKVHHKYLFDEFPDESLEQLKQHVQLKAEDESNIIIKEAGIFDTVHNVVTEKGRSLSRWERQNQKATEKLRKDGMKLIDAAQGLLSEVISDLKTMAHHRAVREPQQYVETAKNIVTKFSKQFDAPFTTYYSTIVEPRIQQHEKIMAQEKAKAEAEAAKLQPQEQPPQAGLPPIPDLDLQTPQATTPSGPPENVPPMLGGPEAPPPPQTPQFTAELEASQPKPVQAPMPVETVRELDPSEVPPSVLDMVNKLNARKKAKTEFFNSLKVFADEDPTFLANYILKYARSIQHEDLETAVKLFNIVKQIKRG
jgi:hypothetical protein